MKKATYSEEQSRPRMANHTTSHLMREPQQADRSLNTAVTIKKPTKIARVLAHLLTGASINRFEAERIGDHCLPSTISSLANRHGLVIQRQQESVPNRWGDPCPVTRYTLPRSQHQYGRAVLVALTRQQAKGDA